MEFHVSILHGKENQRFWGRPDCNIWLVFALDIDGLEKWDHWNSLNLTQGLAGRPTEIPELPKSQGWDQGSLGTRSQAWGGSHPPYLAAGHALPIRRLVMCGSD